ncbi:radical SAM protein [Pseudobacteriovorax antillogorgiicola]|uniref:Radical SAM additional 4Fe4S-binding SPASM domain-containing protein n=1 Tax=Pseudobacteriovorax antillogorgiicola TaxID=1513793 RepID=A0A1Y6B997_9BACT|nr:radical SAM protein [Pseudobacteriovorax antillogorgiicola]TCS58742.1 radical SAM protein with 4Fe4S-binding SPASM domain [Pseudobacteriovorax antillogorgiicola]SME95233.1 radical SAM additional 4Fe4S-binding SPASM domain-containing protein [Pseudobacteriovorax antillogorgiicola]
MLFAKLIEKIEYKALKAISLRRPMAIQLDITNACNLSCTHCYHPHHSNKGAIGIESWKGVLDEVERFLLKYSFDPEFIICGGEPLLSPLFKPIVTRIGEQFKGARIVVLTNGTIYRSSLLAFLYKYPISVQISLDGPNQETHDQVRGDGSFEKTVEGIRQFNDFCDVSILSILSSRTRPWIKQFFENARSLNVHAQNFTRLIEQGSGKEMTSQNLDRVLSPLELKNAYKEIILQSFLTEVPTNTSQPLYALLDKSFGSSGLFGFDALIIDYRGQLKLTSRADFVLGNILEHDLETLYIDNLTLNRLRNGEVEVCGDCELFNLCGGDRNAAYAEYGSFLAKDPGCWKLQ